MNTVTDSEHLRTLYGEPSELAMRKTLTQLDEHCRNFIAASPFLVIGSSRSNGAADVSPRGDAPGFVAVLDDKTLLLPDRAGNRRVDTLSNVVDNPNVGLIFFVPGMNETLRINGVAEITTDAALLEPLVVKGKAPVSGLLIHVQEAFLHCAKALIRSRLWDSSRHIERKSFPSLGRMLADQIAGLDAAAADDTIQESYTKRLY